MGAGIEDVVAVKALETGIVPPVPNYSEPDPELGAAEPVARRRLPGHVRASAGRRLRLADRDDAAALDASRRMAATAHPSELGFALPRRRRGGLAFLAGSGRAAASGAQLEVVQRRLRVVDDGAIQPAATGPAAARQRQLPSGPGHHGGTRRHQPGDTSRLQPAPVTDAAPAAAPDMAQTAPPETTAAERPVEPVPAAPQGEDPVAAAVLDVVESLTGYPRDLLDLDLDLEADLGVDTVKQAEVFAAVRERFGIARDDDLKLRDFPTLAHVIGFVHDRRAGSGRPGAAAPPTAAAPAAAPVGPDGAAGAAAAERPAEPVPAAPPG